MHITKSEFFSTRDRTRLFVRHQLIAHSLNIRHNLSSGHEFRFIADNKKQNKYFHEFMKTNINLKNIQLKKKNKTPFTTRFN